MKVREREKRWRERVIKSTMKDPLRAFIVGEEKKALLVTAVAASALHIDIASAMKVLLIAHEELRREGERREGSFHFIIHFYAFFIHHQHHSRRHGKNECTLSSSKRLRRLLLVHSRLGLY